MDSFSPLIIFGLIVASEFGFRHYKTNTNNSNIKTNMLGKCLMLKKVEGLL
jgi:hypothetical protein